MEGYEVRNPLHLQSCLGEPEEGTTPYPPHLQCWSLWFFSSQHTQTHSPPPLRPTANAHTNTQPRRPVQEKTQ